MSISIEFNYYLCYSVVVLAGDLNYRTDVDNITARDLVKAKDLDALLSYDQVTLMRLYLFCSFDLEY